MQRKLKGDFIKEYSKQFSEKITNDFFAGKATISGKEIINVSPSKQVNFFILKILFSKWQEEMKNLESPYFDYKNNEVRRAMVDFMNILSQHIEVSKDHFLTLAEEAVASTLTLLMAPDQFLRSELQDKDVTQVNEKITRPLFKYIKVYKSDLETFFNQHAGDDLEEFLAHAEEYFKDIDGGDELQSELANLSKVIPITTEDLVDNEEAPEPVIENEIENEPDPTSFFDGDFEEEDAEEDEVPEEADEEDESDEEPDDDESEVEEPEDSIQEQTEGEEVTYEEDTVAEVQEETNEEQEEEDEDNEENGLLNEKFSEEKTTINDQFTQKEEEKVTVAEKLENNKKVGRVMEAISVNHRYMFTKELFDGDREAFTNAIEKIESSASFDDAVELLVQNYAKERDWDMNSEEVKELLKIVFRKFR